MTVWQIYPLPSYLVVWPQLVGTFQCRPAPEVGVRVLVGHNITQYHTILHNITHYHTISQVGQDSKARVYSLVEASYGAGVMFGPSLGGFLYELGGFLLPFLLLGCAFLVVSSAAFAALQQPEECKYEVLELER